MALEGIVYFDALREKAFDVLEKKAETSIDQLKVNDTLIVVQTLEKAKVPQALVKKKFDL